MKATTIASKTILCLCLYALLFFHDIEADCTCPSYLLSTKIDTLSTGVVAATRCYRIQSETTTVCLTDTFSEQHLLDTLVKFCGHSRYVFIAHIDSAFPITPADPTVWPKPIMDSLHIVVDSCLKGSLPKYQYWFVRSGACLEPATKSSQRFLVFADAVDGFDDMGIDPAPYCGEKTGFYLDGTRIIRTGWYSGMPGVSLDLSFFFDAALSVANRTGHHESHFGIGIDAGSLPCGVSKPTAFVLFDCRGRNLGAFTANDMFLSRGFAFLPNQLYIVYGTNGNPRNSVRIPVAR